MLWSILFTYGIAVIRCMYEANGDKLSHSHEFTYTHPHNTSVARAKVLWSIWLTYRLKAVVRYIYNAYIL